jgi:hypothetical protein
MRKSHRARYYEAQDTNAGEKQGTGAVAKAVAPEPGSRVVTEASRTTSTLFDQVQYDRGGRGVEGESG